MAFDLDKLRDQNVKLSRKYQYEVLNEHENLTGDQHSLMRKLDVRRLAC